MNNLNTKELYKIALKLAIPIMVQNLINTLVNTADTIMLGFVGQSAMAAASLANQYTFVLFCVFFGVATGTSVLASQYYGKGDYNTIERVMRLAVRFSVIIAVIFTVLSVLFPERIMLLFTDSSETVAIGTEYLRILSLSFIFSAISTVYVSALRSIGKVVFPSLMAIVSLTVNILINAVFIFGLLGMPKLGVTGVAIGTVVARITEFVLCLIYSAKCEIKYRMQYILEKAGVLTQDFLKICFPSIGNDLVWSLATTVFAVILGHMGDDIVAANAVAVMVVNIGAIAMRGFANATTILIGQALGANLIEKTKEYARKLIWLTVYVAVAGCIIIVALRPFIMKFYSDKLTEVAVPLMALAAYVVKLPPIWVYFVMTLDELEKMPFIIIHLRKYQWMKNITRDFG